MEKKLDINKVCVSSKENKIHFRIDGVEIKRIKKFNVSQYGSSSKALITLQFECDLITKEQ